jgi:tetratricopeptide (TPR) repeat protein
VLFDQLKALAKRTAPDMLKAAAQPYRDMPEVIIPLYERVIADAPAPGDAQAMVVLANAYWLTGRGPNAVEQLATRAKQIDPNNRGAWHLWALTQSSVRKRVERWLEVSKRFPADQLARAALADNATSLANDEQDPVALKLAISTYESLLADAPGTAQRLAIEESLKALRNFRF